MYVLAWTVATRLTQSIRIGTVNDLVDLGLAHLEAADGAGLGGGARRVVPDDHPDGIGVALVAAAVQVGPSGAGLVLRRVVVLGQHGDGGLITGVEAVHQGASESVVGHLELFGLF